MCNASHKSTSQGSCKLLFVGIILFIAAINDCKLFLGLFKSYLK